MNKHLEQKTHSKPVSLWVGSDRLPSLGRILILLKLSVTSLSEFLPPLALCNSKANSLGSSRELVYTALSVPPRFPLAAS